MFALLISEHPLWKYVLRPVILEENNPNYFPINSYPTKQGYNSKEKESELTLDQVRILEYYETTSESYLLKRFVHDKMNVAEFQRKFTPSFPHADIILKTVERANYKMAELAVKNRIPIFLKKKKYQTVYLSDQIGLPNSHISLLPSFSLKEDQLQYTLQLHELAEAEDDAEDGIKEEERIGKRRGRVFPIPMVVPNEKLYLLSNEPCCMVVKNRLFIFKQANYKKVSTFFSKQSVEVPTDKLEAYMNSFVKKTLEIEPIVDVHGFTVDRCDVPPQPILVVTTDLTTQTVLSLLFRYGNDNQNIEVKMDECRERLVSMEDTGKYPSEDGHNENRYSFKVYERRPSVERKYIDRLKSLGLVEKNCFFYRTEGGSYSMIEWLVQNKTALGDFTIRQDCDERHFVLEKVSVKVDLVDYDMDWYELRGMVKVGQMEIPFAQLRGNIIEGNREYKMKDGNYVMLPEEIFTKYSDLLQRTTKGDVLKIRRSLVGMLGDMFPIAKNIQFKLGEEEVLPQDINATLRKYQVTGYSWLCKLYQSRFGGCLADDMGLGKTLQFLAFLRSVYPKQRFTNGDNTISTTISTKGGTTEKVQTKWCYTTNEPSLFEQPKKQICQSDESEEGCRQNLTPAKEMTKEMTQVNPSLIVVPTSLVFNWVHEKLRFTPTLTHYVYAGDKRIQSSQIEKVFSHYNLVITTYGVLRNDIDYLKNCTFECVILDESQYLKNPSSQIYKAVSQLNAKTFFCSTGTPIENGMMDLWAQMNITNCDLLGSQTYFHRCFETPIQKNNDPVREGVLRSLIKPFILRRTKKEVASDLPDKYMLEVYCEMSEEHKSYYEKQKSAIRNTLMDEIMRLGKPQEMTVALSSLTLLRQLANQVSLVDENQNIESTKVEEIMRRLQSLKEEGHKVLVFSSFVRFLEVIEERLREEGYSYSKIVGATRDRKSQVERFQNDENTFCFLISLKAGGVGLNLTKADYVFLIDPWWNPAAEQQAEDRAYRIGQMRNVFVYRFIMKETIEEKVLLLQKKKRDIAGMFIDKNNPFEEMSKEEWKELLG